MSDPIPTPPPTPPADPPKSWFGRLSPEVRALLVLIASAALSVGWQHLFPGTTPPPLPLPQSTPGVLVLTVSPAAPAPVTAAGAK